ncbi:MAG: peptidoglycan-binding protein, partial [Acidimicrobiia bacterium]
MSGRRNETPTETLTETSLPRDGSAKSRKPQRGWLAAGVTLAAVAIAVVGYWLIWGSEDGSFEQTASIRTAEVVRTDLTETETLDGTLGFAEGDPISTGFSGILTSSVDAGEVVTEGAILYSVDAEPVVLLYGEAPAFRDIGLGDGELMIVNRVAGTLTAVAQEYSIASEGSNLYWVNNQPVTLLYGDIPAWRNLRRNIEGPDVRQLEESLVALGYDPDGTVTIDEDFTSSTEAMVERWQENLGAAEDGRVDLGEVVFLPGPVQITDILSDPGATVAGSQTLMVVAPITDTERPDVAQLQESLLRLGFGTGLEVNGIFDDETEAALKQWQESVGMENDGVVDLGEVVFLSGAVRIADELVTLGSPVNAGTPVLATSSSEIVVTVDLPATDRDLLA